jgi:hypothetical protein
MTIFALRDNLVIFRKGAYRGEKIRLLLASTGRRGVLGD